MKKALQVELGEHYVDYLVLATGTVFFLMFLRFFQGDKFASYMTVLTFSSFYVVWGIGHHMRDDSVNLKNVLEYILISLGVLLLLSVLFFR
ncbi:MAG: hypothetical protein WAT72_04445 [Microgenomates group bacterium]|jgi:hypothetical protein|nr:hypothetical protein [Candidatus Woesebacteria bacterium]MBP6883518.1 hypothetical protein [Candidatus Woesebacteria bacterium]QQR63711.1 MAG: hypothetical protein IPH70_04385 [Candidatus Roizmanbacteria bacterium]